MPEPGHSDAYTHLTDPSNKIDMWGPRTHAHADGYATGVPRKTKPWGLPDVGWALLALLAANILLFPVAIVLAASQYDLDLDTPEGLDRLSDALTKVLTHGSGLVCAMILQWVAFLAVPLWVTFRKGHRSLAKDFGFWFKRADPLRGLALAVGMQIVMAGVSLALQHTSLDLSDADNTGMVTDQTGFYLVFMIVGATIGAPITEELLFRGLLLRAFLRKFARWDLAPVRPGVTDHFHPADVSQRRRTVGTVAAIVASSLCFGAMHAQALTVGSMIVVAQTGLLGLVFAIVAVRTRRLGVTLWAHFFFNTVSIVMTLLAASH